MATSTSTLLKKPTTPKLNISGLNTNKGLMGSTQTSTSPGSFKQLTPIDIAYNSAPTGKSTPITQGFSSGSHPEGNVKSSTITKTDPLGGTTVHKQDYHVGTTPGLLSSVQPKANATNAASQTAGQTITDLAGNTGIAKFDPKTGKPYGSTTQNTSTPSSVIPPVNTNNFSGYVSGETNASKNAINSGQDQIQNSSKGLYYTQTNPQEATRNYQNTLGNISTEQTPEVKRAQEEYNTFSKASPFLLGDVANNPNVAATVSAGRGAQLGQVLSAEQQALGQNVQNALQGQGQQITAANEAGGLAGNAQGQGITAGSNVLNAGTTQQAQGISGLGNAASIVKPVSDFPFVFDPMTGTFSTPGTNGAGNAQGSPQLTFNPQTDAQSLAQQVMDKKISYNDAISALGYGGKNPTAEGQLSQAVIGRGGNPTILKSQNQSQGDFTTKYTEGKAKLDAADALAGQIADTFKNNSSLNQSDLSLTNTIKQIYSGAVAGTPDQQKLTQQVTNFISTLGLDPATVIPVAAQNKQSIATLLTSLADTYKATNVDPYKNGGSYAGSSSSNTSSVPSGNISWDNI